MERVGFVVVIIVYHSILGFGFAALGKANPLNEQRAVLLGQVFNFAAGPGGRCRNQKVIWSLCQTQGST